VEYFYVVTGTEIKTGYSNYSYESVVGFQLSLNNKKLKSLPDICQNRSYWRSFPCFVCRDFDRKNGCKGIEVKTKRKFCFFVGEEECK
jgi:hypothetical protein